MARPVTTLVIFFVAFNLFAGILMSTGVAAMIGVDASVGGDDAVNQQLENGQDVSSGSSTGSTLFGMYNVIGKQIGGLYKVVYPGLNMLERAGVPTYITRDFLGNLFSVMIFIGLASYFRGWDL